MEYNLPEKARRLFRLIAVGHVLIVEQFMEPAISGNLVRTPVVCEFDPTPIKSAGAELVPKGQLDEQARAAERCAVPVNYHALPGTCGDERGRESLFSGAPATEVRPSVWGGPIVYGVLEAELTKYFGDNTILNGKERAGSVGLLLKTADIRGGGHGRCKANDSAPDLLRIIADDPDLVTSYAASQLGEAGFRQDAMDAVVANARQAVRENHLAGWDNGLLCEVLADIYGPEYADYAMENLAGEHEGATLLRVETPGITVNRNALLDQSAVGRGSFVQDESYAALIEDALSTRHTSEESARAQLVAAHAREAILAAIAQAVPNEELYQARFRLAA